MWVWFIFLKRMLFVVFYLHFILSHICFSRHTSVRLWVAWGESSHAKWDGQYLLGMDDLAWGPIPFTHVTCDKLKLWFYYETSEWLIGWSRPTLKESFVGWWDSLTCGIAVLSHKEIKHMRFGVGCVGLGMWGRFPTSSEVAPPPYHLFS